MDVSFRNRKDIPVAFDRPLGPIYTESIAFDTDILLLMRHKLYVYSNKDNSYTLVKTIHDDTIKAQNLFFKLMNITKYYQNKNKNNNVNKSLYLLLLAHRGTSGKKLNCYELKLSKHNANNNKITMDSFYKTKERFKNIKLNVRGCRSCIIGEDNELIVIMHNTNNKNTISIYNLETNKIINLCRPYDKIKCYNMSSSGYNNGHSLIRLSSNNILFIYNSFRMYTITLTKYSYTVKSMKVNKIENNFKEIINDRKQYVNYGYIKFNNFIILFGGDNEVKSLKYEAISSIYIYNILTNVWYESHIKLPDAMWWFENNVIIDNKSIIHILGGYKDHFWNRSMSHYDISIYKLLPHLVKLVVNYWLNIYEKNMRMIWNANLLQMIQVYIG